MPQAPGLNHDWYNRINNYQSRYLNLWQRTWEHSVLFTELPHSPSFKLNVFGEIFKHNNCKHIALILNSINFLLYRHNFCRSKVTWQPLLCLSWATAYHLYTCISVDSIYHPLLWCNIMWRTFLSNFSTLVSRFQPSELVLSQHQISIDFFRISVPL